MPDIKLKCGARGCVFVTDKLEASIAWGLLQYHRQDAQVQIEAGAGGEDSHICGGQHRANLPKKTDRPGFDMDTT